MKPFNYSKIKEEKWDSEILGLIAAIYKFAGKQELYLKQRPDELEKLVEIAKIQSTEASNAIEGIVTTNTRIKQLVEEKTTPKNRDEEEIAGYRDVLNIIHESFDTIPITQNYILQLHKILCSYMNNPLAGRTKNVQNYISASYPDGRTEVLFTPLAPFETPEALDRICEEYNRVIGNYEVEPLLAIPIFIHDFLCIHPFNDGNGRTGRMIMFKQCLQNRHIPFVLLDRDRAFYLRGLKEWDFERNYLMDTLLTQQDIYASVCEQFDIFKDFGQKEMSKNKIVDEND